MEPKQHVDEHGTKRYLNEEGKLHRLDGPAVEWASGHKYWYVEGKKLTEQEFNNLLENNKQEPNNVPENSAMEENKVYPETHEVVILTPAFEPSYYEDFEAKFNEYFSELCFMVCTDANYYRIAVRTDRKKEFIAMESYIWGYLDARK